jgi:hypothetical protein
MANDAQYKTLLSKYNVAVARCRDLEEQNRTNTQHWKAEVTELKSDLDSARELCQIILSKDHDEMTIGKGDSFYSTPTAQLITRTIKSYRDYCEGTTNLLKGIHKESERRRAHIESLEDQIKQHIAGNAVEFEISETSEQEIEKSKKSPEYLGTSKTVKAAAEAGKIDIIIEESKDTEVEIDGEMRQVQELVNISEQAKLVPNAVPIRDSAKKVKRIEEARENVAMPHMVNLMDYEKKFTEVMWMILEVIGREGLSKYPEIEKRVKEMDSNLTDSPIRKSTAVLENMKMLSKETLTGLPLTSVVCVYMLTDTGERLYKYKFGKSPVLSEATKVRKEHDNLDHGYGILEMESILRDTGRYKEIRVFNRSRPKELPDGFKYIADIVCVPNNAKFEEYIEYERGNHTQADFNAKCNKMCKFTRYLNFVVPNRDILLKKLKPQVDAWIQSRGQESIRTIKVRLTTPPELKDKNVKNAWIMVYDLSIGVDPVKDFTKKEVQ